MRADFPITRVLFLENVAKGGAQVRLCFEHDEFNSYPRLLKRCEERERERKCHHSSMLRVEGHGPARQPARLPVLPRLGRSPQLSQSTSA